MSYENIIERLNKIKEQVESDNFTRENIDELIEDIEKCIINNPF
jgi:hypothetical protein